MKEAQGGKQCGSCKLLLVVLLVLGLRIRTVLAQDDSSVSYLRSRSLKTDYDRLLQTSSCSESCCTANFPPVCPNSSGDTNVFAGVPTSVQYLLICVLLLLSATFAGLTLGLLSLDKTGLQIVMEGDDEKNVRYAKNIYPVRENGNLLLCTLLLGNVACNSLLSILLADKAGGLAGFLTSTLLILVFAEIIPQAACARYALQVGSRAVPLVRVIIILFWPIAFPLGWLLDRCLGQELATVYSNAEMLKLLQIHVAENAIDPDTAVTMTGALKYKNTAVKDVMTPLSNTFMLSIEEKLNFETVAKIFQTGYSRIPVYEVNKDNVVGLLFVKDLIFVDPEDGTRIADFIDIFGRGLHAVWSDDTLGDVLRELKQGKSHMALVRDVNNKTESDPYYEVKGIITLEDIIEEILGAEIVDETDAFVDGTHLVQVNREETFKWARLRMLDSKIVDRNLSHDETMAVAAHLWRNYPDVVALLTEQQLTRYIAETVVSILPTAEQKVGQAVPDDLLYERGLSSDVCTLILAGKVTVLAGSDQFRSDLSSWALLGAGALKQADYQPDFTAFVSNGPCRCLRLTYARFAAAVDASSLEKFSRHTETDKDMDPTDIGSAGFSSLSTGTLTRRTADATFEPTSSALAGKPSRKDMFFTALHLVRKDELNERDGGGAIKGQSAAGISGETLPNATKGTHTSSRSIDFIRRRSLDTKETTQDK